MQLRSAIQRLTVRATAHVDNEVALCARSRLSWITGLEQCLSSSLFLLVLQFLELLLLVVGAIWLTLYVTYRCLHRLHAGDRYWKSFFAWLRDLADLAFGLG